MKHIYLYCLLLAAVVFSACSNSRSAQVEPSDDPTVSSLTFQAQDSFPGLAKAVFVIEDRLDTGWIYNDDSLMFQTRIDSVVPRFIFNHTPASAVLFTAFDTMPLTGYDTVNFTVSPSYLYVLSESEKVEKWYKIFVTVHQVDPDLFVWEQINKEIYSPIAAEQKAVWLNGRFSLFVNDGISLYLYQSSDGVTWAETAISGLPNDCKVRNIIQSDSQLFYAAQDKVYTSLDGSSWTEKDFSSQSYTFLNMLIYFNDSIWALATKNDTLRLAVSKDATQFELRGAMPDNFPVSDFASVTFTSKTYRSRSLLIGGYDRFGNALNSRWAVEFSPGRGYRWTNYSIEQPSFADLTGASVIWYNNLLYMFGGADKDYNIGDYDMLYSDDEGMTFQVPDSAHNYLPESYRSRSFQSVVLDDSGHIFIIGGKSRTEVFTDVFRGKLNSIGWQ